jgi:hypothetical protein
MEGQTACCTAACYTAVLHCGISVASAAQFMSELGHLRPKGYPAGDQFTAEVP